MLVKFNQEGAQFFKKDNSIQISLNYQKWEMRVHNTVFVNIKLKTKMVLHNENFHYILPP